MLIFPGLPVYHVQNLPLTPTFSFKQRCTAIGKDDTRIKVDGEAVADVWKLGTLDDDQFDDFIDKYGFDYEDAIQNALDCDAAGGGDPSMPTELPPFGKAPPMPPCFVNLAVKSQDEEGESDGEPDPGMIGDDGYTPGACGLHYEFKNPSGGDYVYQVEATLKGAQGGALATATYQDLAPTAVIQGKESDEDAILPYDFYIGVDSSDEDAPFQFWYSDQYWKSSDDGGEMFPGCDGSSGNCGFTCDPPSDDPPASATEAHPLPTALSYASGWCTFHIKQNDISGSVWELYGSFYDDAGNTIGDLDKEWVDSGDSTSIKGILPHDLVIEPSKATVKFTYGDTVWEANGDKGYASRGEDGHECGYGQDGGKWDNTLWEEPTVSMDCGFWC